MAITVDPRPKSGDTVSITGKEMCEYIADTIQQLTGKRPNPQDIWHMSPTGEIWRVWALYQQCKAVREAA